MSEKLRRNDDKLHMVSNEQLEIHAKTRKPGKVRHKAQKELIRRGKLDGFYKPEKKR